MKQARRHFKAFPDQNSLLSIKGMLFLIVSQIAFRILPGPNAQSAACIFQWSRLKIFAGIERTNAVKNDA